jgi:hypothetical protein
MAAEPMTTIVAPRIEFNSNDTGSATDGVRIRIFDTLGNIEWECCINAATWVALDAVIDGADAKYIPMNHTSPKGDGSLTPGGLINPVDWDGAA